MAPSHVVWSTRNLIGSLTRIRDYREDDLERLGMILLCCDSGFGHLKGPSIASGGVVPGEFGAGTAWSGLCGQRADAGENFVEQLVARWQAQDERTGVVDQPGRDADQPVPQGGDHGLALAHAVPGQGAAGCGGSGELVQPACPAGGEQGTPTSVLG